MQKRVSVSEARTNLFDLIEYVNDHPDSMVVIEHRSRTGRTVLLDESRLRQLEAIEVEHSRRAKPFKLLGSAELTVSEDEFDQWFEENRRRQNEMALAKFADL